MSNEKSTQQPTPKVYFLDSEIPTFSRWTDGKNIWIIGDKKHVWKDNRPTDVITLVYLIHAQSEKESWMNIDVFNQLIQEGKIYKGTVKIV